MGSRQSFATPHSRVPSAMIGQYTLKPDTHSNRDTGTTDVKNENKKDDIKRSSQKEWLTKYAWLKYEDGEMY